MPVTDTTHATFWRRLVRWLVDGVPDQVDVTTTHDRVEPGEAVKLTAEVVDAAFVEVNDAASSRTVTSPSGKTTEVPLEWTVDARRRVPRQLRPRRRRASTTVKVHGRSRGDKDLGDDRDARARVGRRRRVLRRRDARAAAEAHRRRNRRPLLHAANAASLPEAISYSGRGVTVVEERELWDMPALFLLLVGLVGGEWGYRRVRGLA